MLPLLSIHLVILHWLRIHWWYPYLPSWARSVLMVGHSNAMCPLPKHLKHLMLLVPVLEADVLGFTSDFPWSVEDPSSLLGLSFLFRLWELEEFLLPSPFLLNCCSTYTALSNRSSNSTYSCNSTTSLILGFSPLKKQATIASLS